MNSEQILTELETVWIRYRAGLTNLEQAKQEQSLLRDMLKAYETTELQRKIEAIEAVLESREDGG